MASNSVDEYQLEEDIDLDFIEQLLAEDDEIFENEVDLAIQNIPKPEKSFPCSFCPKVCLSSGGLKRHLSAKHPEVEIEPSSTSKKNRKPEDILTIGTFKRLVKNSLSKLEADKCYCEDILSSFANYTVNTVEDVFPCYDKISNCILKFNGNTERFYPEFYNTIAADDVFPGLPENCKLLLGFELANHVLAYLTGGSVNDAVVSFNEKVTLDEKQKAIVTYISGYVVGKFYRKLRFISKNKNEFQEQYLSILETFKYVEGIETDTKHQKLVDIKNRGGLWKVNSDAVMIFSITECYFQFITKSFVNKIDVPKAVTELMSKPSVLIYYNGMRRQSELFVKKEIALNLLADMLSLYFRVRCHSYAKSILQNHKMSKNTTKAKSLRTERKRDNESLEFGH